MNPFTGTTYTGASRSPGNQHLEAAPAPYLASRHHTYSIWEQEPNRGLGSSAQQPSAVLTSSAPTLPGVPATVDHGSRLGANEASNVPSSIARTLPALQANLDRHTRAYSDGLQCPPGRHVGCEIRAGAAHLSTNSGVSVSRRQSSAPAPARFSAGAPASEPPIPGPQRHRNQSSKPPHANRDFFYYWLRKHDVVQALPAPRRLVAESALVRLHGMGKQVLDVYELTGRQWEELGVSLAVGQGIRAAVVEFTREKRRVLDEFMQKGSDSGWFVPFQDRGY